MKKIRALKIDNENGIIIAHHGMAVEVRFESGERRMVRVKRRTGYVVGDRVVARGKHLKRLPRRTALRRRDARGGVHLVGANLDVLGVVAAPQPLSPPGFIDRAIVAARIEKLRPILLVNKCDLSIASPFVQEMHSRYAAAVHIFSLSAHTGEGLAAFAAFLGQSGYRGIFVGTTGVGKSSLLNALCPSLDLRVGAISETRERGRNTTSVSTLHSLNGGGELVDTPGFNDFGLVDITVRDLAMHFPGFELAGDGACRFRDCRHGSEPGCAVTELVADNRIPAERYETYLALLGEVEAHAERFRSGARTGRI